MRLLVVNTGSSSVRLALYTGDAGSLRLLTSQRYSGVVEMESQLDRLLGSQSVDAVAHRVVHGGEKLSSPCLIDADIESEIKRHSELAPLHNPHALGWIHSCRKKLGNNIPQIAVFDTGFYAALPDVARSYALPQQLMLRHGLHRYGFHGIAHQSMWNRWRNLHPEIEEGGRVISLQLGAGCSITAISNGKPQDTSMGFSPLEGLIMATRSGDIDPGLLLYLLRKTKLSADELDHMLNWESGLLGIAGESDMRKLLVSNEPDAQKAVELYCYRAHKYVGAYLAVLGGADAILFGGGVGENAPEIRERILAGLEWAGIMLDNERNQSTIGAEGCISSDDSRVAVWTIAVDEAQMLAEEAAALLMIRASLLEGE